MASLDGEERAIVEWQLGVTGFGEAGQQRLKNATVLISRVGGVGSGVLSTRLDVGRRELVGLDRGVDDVALGALAVRGALVGELLGPALTYFLARGPAGGWW